LDGWRNDLGPHLLEALPRHHAVLDGEYAEQEGIDEKRLAQRSSGRGIDGPGHEQAVDESDRVEERAEEDQVADDAIEESENAVQGVLLCGAPIPVSLWTAYTGCRARHFLQVTALGSSVAIPSTCARWAASRSRGLQATIPSSFNACRSRRPLVRFLPTSVLLHHFAGLSCSLLTVPPAA